MLTVYIVTYLGIERNNHTRQKQNRKIEKRGVMVRTPAYRQPIPRVRISTRGGSPQCGLRGSRSHCYILYYKKTHAISYLILIAIYAPVELLKINFFHLDHDSLIKDLVQLVLYSLA